MSLKERVYSVLVVSSSESLNGALRDLLPEVKYSPVRFVPTVDAAKRAVTDREYDFVIISSPLPDDVGTRFAVDVCTSKGTVALLLVKAELLADTLEKVTEHGVFTLAKPLSKAVLSMALGWLAAARERLRKEESKNLSMEEKMEEIRFVNRAKWLLISQLKMDEPEAHRYIEKQAMDRCVTKKQVAEEIIKTYL